jgi:hypothetical protein
MHLRKSCCSGPLIWHTRSRRKSMRCGPFIRIKIARLLLVHSFCNDLVNRRFSESGRYPRSTTKAAAVVR